MDQRAWNLGRQCRTFRLLAGHRWRGFWRPGLKLGFDEGQVSLKSQARRQAS